MLNNPAIMRLIIYAMFGIIVVLVLAVIILAVKKNVYYVDENGKEIVPRGAKVIHVSDKKLERQPEGALPTNNVSKQETMMTEAPEPSTAARAVVLEIHVNGHVVKTSVQRFPCMIGREADVCDLVIQEPAVSRRHAQIISSHGELYLEDVSEHNGTFLNGEKLPSLGRAPLKEGDHINLGRAEITVLSIEY